jgi:pilus assembly protein CpaB
MKKYGSLIAFGLALVFGVLAVVLANHWLARQAEQPAVAPGERRPPLSIVVAAEDLSPGSVLGVNHLALKEWPREMVPEGAFQDKEAVAGRMFVNRLAAGEPVLAADLAPPGSGSAMVASIRPGMRAMAIRVDEVSGVAGFVLPNTYVDVIGVEKRGREYKSATVLSGIRVLAVAQDTAAAAGKAKVVQTVTLELKPEEAERLLLQTQMGSTRLALRNSLDAGDSEDKKAEVRPKAEPRRHRMVIYRQGETPEVVNF